jgi:GNAT superfamily N-acetyltransferase
LDPIDIVGYRPGAIGKITELHATYYHRHWHFGLFFERKVATEMAAFLGRFNPSADGFWLAVADDTIIGSIAIDGIHAADQGAHLRWFIVDAVQQGCGVGERLLRTAIDFCRSCQYHRIYLWTFAGLDAARHLYKRYGFECIRQQEDNQWGITVVEQQFVCDLQSPSRE